MDIQQFLKDNDACQPAQDWAKDKSLQEIWDTCDQPNWLIWLLKKLEFKTRTFQELGIMFAESVTNLMRDERSKEAVLDLRRWLNGQQVDLMMVKRSARAARAADAADAAYAAAYAAAGVSAADAADAAYAAAYATAYAADAAATAAAYATAAAAAAYATAATAADIIRNHITLEQVAQAAQKMGIEI